MPATLSPEDLRSNDPASVKTRPKIFFINMSMLQTVAMATNNLKDNHFLAIFHLFLPFLELASVKYLESRQSCENDFGQ